MERDGVRRMSGREDVDVPEPEPAGLWPAEERRRSRREVGIVVLISIGAGWSRAGGPVERGGGCGPESGPGAIDCGGGRNWVRLSRRACLDSTDASG